jgi:predicted RNA-binding protein (virulence factor B family)
MYGSYNEGDSVEVIIKKVKQDGKLELCIKRYTFNEVERNAQKILDCMSLTGVLLLNDNSSPQQIMEKLNISKSSFKRAVGRLLKQNQIKMTDKGIQIIHN